MHSVQMTYPAFEIRGDFELVAKFVQDVCPEVKVEEMLQDKVRLIRLSLPEATKPQYAHIVRAKFDMAHWMTVGFLNGLDAAREAASQW